MVPFTSFQDDQLFLSWYLYGIVMETGLQFQEDGADHGKVDPGALAKRPLAGAHT